MLTPHAKTGRRLVAVAPAIYRGAARQTRNVVNQGHKLKVTAQRAIRQRFPVASASKRVMRRL